MQRTVVESVKSI